MKRCKNCRFWTSLEELRKSDEVLDGCRSPHMIYGDPMSNLQPPSLHYWDFGTPGHKAYLLMGPEFGCVHFEQKEPA